MSMKLEEFMYEHLTKLNPETEIKNFDMTINQLLILAQSVSITDTGIHIRKHKMLHKMLDELIADFEIHTEKRVTQATIMDLLQWSHDQTLNPA